MIDLSSYGAIESALFIKWEIPTYGTKYWSDYHTDVTIGGNVYTNDGAIMGITELSEQIKSSAAQITIGLSGLVPGLRDEVASVNVKGSNIEIYRGFFDPATHALLDLTPNANPAPRFVGFVTNATIVDKYDPRSGIGSNDIAINCSSIVEVLEKQISGRRTNPRDFPGEKTMDRVPILSQEYIYTKGD